MNKDIIPLLLAVFLVLLSIGMNLFTGIELDGTLYIGIGWLTFAACFFFINKKVYLLVFGLTLLAGLFSLIDFFYVSIKFSVGFLLINPIFIILIICFIIFNKEELRILMTNKSKLNSD
jgi:hypothetical protein